MNQFFLRSSYLFLFCTVLFTSCKKEEPPEPEPAPTPGTTTAKFSWKPEPGALVTADSAYYYSSFTTIYAFKNGSNNSLEINLSALSVGNYSLSSSTGNDLTFVTNAVTYTASPGSFNITGSANNKLSGNFSATLNGGAITSISGSFETIPQR